MNDIFSSFLWLQQFQLSLAIKFNVFTWSNKDDFLISYQFIQPSLKTVRYTSYLVFTKEKEIRICLLVN